MTPRGTTEERIAERIREGASQTTMGFRGRAVKRFRPSSNSD
jgi:hypothetical protein